MGGKKISLKEMGENGIVFLTVGQIGLRHCLSIPGEVNDLDVLAGELSEGEGDDCGTPRGD